MKTSFIMAFFLVPFLANADDEKYFQEKVRPLLDKYCFDCHDPEDEDSESPFLEDKNAKDITHNRHIWKSVAAQIRNRTMPPKRKKKQPTEFERVELASWIDTYLRSSALEMPEYAGAVLTRRLNRDEYDNTIRDLVGLDLGFSYSFPMDGGGGEGFDNNGETLFLPPLLLERYLESAQLILDKAIITPLLALDFDGSEMLPAESDTPTRFLASKSAVRKVFNSYLKGEYELKVNVTAVEGQAKIRLLVDGIVAETFKVTSPKVLKTKVILQRGIHSFAIQNGKSQAGISFDNVKIRSLQKGDDKKKPFHDKIFKFSAGATKASQRLAAKKNVADFMFRAFRRPVSTEETSKYMAMYDRAINRGDPYEEGVKLALKAVLVSPHFIFMMEKQADSHKIQPLSQFELASRLSYFLWASMPDKTLFDLAKKGKLSDSSVLRNQIKRMLADKKSFNFLTKFTGQWLGTKDVGGKVAPLGRGTDIGYTPELGIALREEPIHLLNYIFQENKSLLDLIESDYMVINKQLAKHYGVKDIKHSDFRVIKAPNKQRGGVLGLGGVHMVTSFPQRTSPVLRGAWVIETILGTPVPPPPDNVPELPVKKNKKKKITIRQMFEQHRNNDVCSACHNLIDPIGFGLENYDLLGRWRTEEKGIPVDASGVMPSGEKFNGPTELKQIILKQKDAFGRHFVSKVLGYSLGRSLLDEDAGTIERILNKLKESDFKSQTLIESVVMSIPFRKTQLISRAAKSKKPKH
ncbi:MAG: DUF1592 domain-containing protein [Lentisphaeraceae bacterium]|nr:DUF1592 domain-containing protein [Lentisphaeraceae bacterium]